MALYHELWDKIVEAADKGIEGLELIVPDHEYATWFHAELKQASIPSYTSQSNGVYSVAVILC